MISITNSEEFAKLVKVLSNDIVDAHIHWRLYCDLHEALKNEEIVWTQSRAFWYLTLNAHSEIAVEHLCRAFDQEQKSLHLLSWLKTIRNNLHLFETPEFKKRLSDNKFVDSLAETLRMPDRVLLDADISECTGNDTLVKKLITYRGSRVAHRSAKLAINNSSPSDKITLSLEEIESLLTRALTILNRYSQLFSAETYSVRMIGADDFRYIFTSVSESVARANSSFDLLSGSED